tara:strand:+ start:3184 stop:5412 length:2229 start_codon:yes stop_codon:yes gene_type:complete
MKIILAVFSLLFSLRLFSQTSGLVMDEEKNPISGASVFFSDQNILVETNENGEFTFSEKIPDNSILHAYKQGYSSKLIKFQQTEDFEIIMAKLHVDLDEVGVSESYSDLGNIKLTSIEKKKIDFVKSSSMVESITELGGVDMISSGHGIQKVVVRGLSGMRVVTYLNGMQINNQQWANDHGIGFTDLGINEVELIKGASSLKYGSEAIGGLLYFKDYPFTAGNKLKGFLASKLNNSSYLTNNQIGLNWNYNNFSVDFYGEYTLSTDYRMPNGDYLFNSRFKQSAYKFSLAHRYKRFQNIFRFHYHQETPGIPGHVHGDPSLTDIIDLSSSSVDLENDYKETRPNQYVDNQLFIYEFKYLADNFKLSLHAGQFINHLVEWEKWTKPGFDLTLTNTQIRPNLLIYLGKEKNINLNLGSQITYVDNKNSPADDILTPDASSENMAAYAIFDYEKDNIGLNAGIRYDYKVVKCDDDYFDIKYDQSFNSTSFSSGIYYKFLENNFRLTYSGAFRAPHFSELFSDGVHHGTNRYEIGSQDLNIEYSNQIDFKYHWANEHLGLVFNPFLQNITDFISINPTGNNSGGYKVYEYLQYNSVQLRGIEMNFHYHPHVLHNLHLEQSYSFLQAINNDSEFGLALVPANSIKSKVMFDFNSYKSLVKYKLNNISLYHIYKFEQNDFSEYEEKTESYNVFNIRLSFKFTSKFDIAFGVNNLLNEEYTPHISRVRGVAGGIPNPGRYISLNMKYSF